ncbi:MAG: fibronectin type III domain-containing protein [Polyangiaceae bacterium]
MTLSVLAFAYLGPASALASDASALQAELLGDARLESQAGSATLNWKAEHTGGPEPTYQLQRSADASFSDPKTLYTGPDQGRYVSGLLDGSYYFRVRARQGDTAWSAWSKPQELVVTHWPESRALSLMGIGALVFLATAFVVLRGTAKTEPS